MIFEQLSAGGCRSYLIGCADTCAAALIDPEISQIDRYLALAARDGPAHPLRDRHAHARRPLLGDAAARASSLGVPVVMHRVQPGAVRRPARSTTARCSSSASCGCTVMHTPGHTRDSMCLQRRGPRVHRRHAADRRAPAAPTCRAATRGALRQPVRPRAAARSGAEGLSGARLQGPQPLDDRRRRSPATRACRSATASAFVEMMHSLNLTHADAPHRGAAHQHERRQDGRTDAGRGRGTGAVHVAGRAAGAHRSCRATT